MVATVVQVTFAINAEQQTAGTAFALTNIRTRTENENNFITDTKAPMYEKGWPGGPLTKDA
jgi:hypothetical protein